MENIVFEVDFGHESEGKVVEENGMFQCYETPLYGGDWMKAGKPFEDKEEAIKYLSSLT